MKFKTGDVVVCVDACRTNRDDADLTFGTFYRVAEARSYFVVLIEGKGDYGYSRGRFEHQGEYENKLLTEKFKANESR